MTDTGLYVHIPYCAKKCTYCDFPSWAGRMDTVHAYADALIREARMKRTEKTVSTLFIGGGTPSILPPAVMERLLRALRECFTFEKDAECTCEANPGALSPGMCDVLKAGGINRVSLGVQAAQKHLLGMLGRIHTFEDAKKSVAMLRSAGIDNLNLDLMFGLPGQSVQDFRESLEAAFSLSPAHISCYALIPEEGTKMQALLDAGELRLPPEDEEREMYSLCRTLCLEKGYIQYEISNFALPGKECRHNIGCWERKEYIGLGCAACGFTDGIRYKNADTLDAYLAGAPAQQEKIGPRDARFESMMLGLRMLCGVGLQAFYDRHGITVAEAFPTGLSGAIKEGLL